MLTRSTCSVRAAISQIRPVALSNVHAGCQTARVSSTSARVKRSVVVCAACSARMAMCDAGNDGMTCPSL